MNKDYAVSPDGKRAAVITVLSSEQKLTTVNYVFNFMEEVKRKMASKEP